MVKHIIMWNLKDEYTDAEKKEITARIKVELEKLKGEIPGLLDIKVQTEYFETSNVDLMLDTSFESHDALKAYAVHPKHVAVADEFVRPYTAKRSCIDFEI